MGRLLTATMGKIATLLGFDGTNFHAVRTDASGHLQVDALTSALPRGGNCCESSDSTRQD